MVSEQIADLIGSHLPFTLTPEQREAALRLGAFIADPRSERCFALRGYAGVLQLNQIAGSFNAVENRLGLHVQTGP